ncbi:hypothetical protein NQZ68_014226 [Dissostichus eleginoides]|nr:hypothetical protein NQZ68_014226 [Dissostichus eleginoides]
MSKTVWLQAGLTVVLLRVIRSRHHHIILTPCPWVRCQLRPAAIIIPGRKTCLSLSHMDSGSAALHTKQENELFIMNCDIDGDMENQVEMEEKTRLINQVLELQHTLEDLSARVDAVKEENLKLKSENQVLGQYIENLMSASSVFQTTDTKSKRK